MCCLNGCPLPSVVKFQSRVLRGIGLVIIPCPAAEAARQTADTATRIGVPLSMGTGGQTLRLNESRAPPAAARRGIVRYGICLLESKQLVALAEYEQLATSVITHQ